MRKSASSNFDWTAEHTDIMGQRRREGKREENGCGRGVRIPSFCLRCACCVRVANLEPLTTSTEGITAESRTWMTWPPSPSKASCSATPALLKRHRTAAVALQRRSSELSLFKRFAGSAPAPRLVKSGTTKASPPFCSEGTLCLLVSAIFALTAPDSFRAQLWSAPFLWTIVEIVFAAQVLYAIVRQPQVASCAPASIITAAAPDSFRA